MRILLACEFYWPSVGGVQEVMRQIGERLAATGHHVTVATSLLADRQSRTLNGVSIAEFAVSGNQVHGLRGDVEGYRRFVLEGGFDVLMVNAAQQWTFDALWPILDDCDFGKVLIPCGFSALYEPIFSEYFARLPNILRKFDQLIFSATEYRDVEFVRAHGIKHYSIVANGASEAEFGEPRDPAFRSRLGIPDDSFVVLTVGSRNGQKGHLELAEAFEVASFPSHATLLLCGSVPAEVATPSTIEKRSALGRLLVGLCRRADRTGPTELTPTVEAVVDRINAERANRLALLVDLPRSDVVQAYLNSDLFALASNIEYSPLVLYEAAAAGLPFVSVPVGNAAEIAGWTGGGVICPAPVDDRGYTRPDPAVVAGCISKLAADPEKRTELGRTGHQSWVERFTWTRLSHKYERILRDAAAAHAIATVRRLAP